MATAKPAIRPPWRDIALAASRKPSVRSARKPIPPLQRFPRDEVREQRLGVDGVLVWVDPIERGATEPSSILYCDKSPGKGYGRARIPTRSGRWAPKKSCFGRGRWVGERS